MVVVVVVSMQWSPHFWYRIFLKTKYFCRVFAESLILKKEKGELFWNKNKFVRVKWIRSGQRGSAETATTTATAASNWPNPSKRDISINQTPESSLLSLFLPNRIRLTHERTLQLPKQKETSDSQPDHIKVFKEIKFTKTFPLVCGKSFLGNFQN